MHEPEWRHRVTANDGTVIQTTPPPTHAPVSPLGHGLRVRYSTAALWSVTGQGSARGATFLASMFTARFLGPDSFGALAIVQSTVSVAAMLAGAGLGVTASRHVAEYRLTDPERAGRILGLSSVVSLVLGVTLAFLTIVSAPFIAGSILNTPSLTVPLRIASLLVLFTALNGYQTGALAGLEAFSAMAKVNCYCGLISFSTIILCTYGGGFRGAVWGTSIAMVATWAVTHVTLRRVCIVQGINWTHRNCWTERTLLYHTSLPAFFSSLIGIPAVWLCSYFVVQQAHGYQELGVYSAADRYRLLLLFVPTAVATSVLPMLSHFRSGNNIVGFRQLLRLNVVVVSAAVSVPALLIALSAPRAIACFGPSYSVGAPILQVLCLSAVFESLNTAVGQAVLTTSAWRRFLFDVALFSIICGLAFVLVPQLGALGLALAY